MFRRSVIRFHNGVALDLNDPRVEPDSQDLSLSPAQVSYAGEYWCLAENSVGSGQSEMLNINVICKYITSSEDLRIIYSKF